MASGYNFTYNNAMVDLSDVYMEKFPLRSNDYGTVYAFGGNFNGSLGTNDTNSSSSPIQVITKGNTWISVSAGGSHSAGVKADGTLWMWGRNAYGQLGNNFDYYNISSPVQTITGGSNWSQVSCGETSTAAIKTDGTLWTWGLNSSGELGDGTTISRSSPVQTITGGSNWSKISVGRLHTAAIKTDGTLWLWGLGTSGQLGDNTTISKSSPVQAVTAGTTWSKVSAGSAYTGAIKTDGTLWLWGYNYQYGNLGDNSQVNRSSPVQTVTAGTNWKEISCSKISLYMHTGAIKTDGTLWMWGGNNQGALGDNTGTNRSSPVQTITFGTNWKSISVHRYRSGAVKTDGTLWMWGSNINNAAIGDGTFTSRYSPVQTLTKSNTWIQVSLGYSHTLAIIAVI